MYTRRFFSQYSIRTILVGTLLIAVAIAWYGPRWYVDQRHQRVVDQVSSFAKVTSWGRGGQGNRFRFSFTLEPTSPSPNASDLAALAELDSLKLEGPLVTDAWLSHLKSEHVAQIRFLDLSGTNITDAVIERLPEMPNLISLDLSGTAVSDAGLASLGRMPNLEHLILRNTKVGDAGLRHIVTSLKNLRTLELMGTRVTGDGVTALSSVPLLGGLGLHNTSVSTEAVERLVEDAHSRNRNINVGYGPWPPAEE